MCATALPKMVLAISSRALFDMSESNAVYESKGVDAYADYQIQHENEVLSLGSAYPVVKKMLDINRSGTHSVEVVLLSRNSADTGLRVFKSIEHYQLPISRAIFTGGREPYPYLTALGAQLFLSGHADDVRSALEAGIAAATILPSNACDKDDGVLRVAFDGDAVLFSDEAEKVYQAHGLKAFAEHERERADQPLSGGPFRRFLAVLHDLQQAKHPIRTALVTSRSAPAHERVIKTLREWNIRIDEALFLGGVDKASFLKAFGADIFFDDQQAFCQSTRHAVATGHVPHGVKNETSEEL